MLKKSILALALVAIVALLVAAPLAFAEPGEPVGDCPPGFMLHPAGEHDHEEHAEHRHVGLDLDSDANGDGWMCVRHVGGEQHVHVFVDNNRRR
jgi:hypothetical protein